MGRTEAAVSCRLVFLYANLAERIWTSVRLLMAETRDGIQTVVNLLKRLVWDSERAEKPNGAGCSCSGVHQDHRGAR